MRPSNGLPAFDVVGLPDAAVKEARNRVRSAAKNCGFIFPVSRITVNLAPADTAESGDWYDLPMLVGILAAGGQLPPPPPDAAFVGELSLAGGLRPVTGMLPMALAARRAGISTLYVPADSAAEATLAEGLTVYPVESVDALVRHLRGDAPLVPASCWAPFGRRRSARLRRCEGAGPGEAGPGDRRRRRAQSGHDRPTGFGQIHAGPASPLHSARPEPAGGPGSHRDPLRSGPHLPGTSHGDPAALPGPPATASPPPVWRGRDPGPPAGGDLSGP